MFAVGKLVGSLLTSAVLAATCAGTTYAQLPGKNPEAEKISEAAMQVFQSDEDQARKKIAEEILSKPENYAAAVYLPLVAELIRQKRNDDAALWFNFTSLRLAFESARCPSSDLAQGITASLESLAEGAMEHIKANPEKIKSIANSAIALDDKTPLNVIGLCDSPVPAASDSAALSKLRQEAQGMYKKSLETATALIERQNQKPTTTRSNLEFTTTTGTKLTASEQCGDATSTKDECRTCCANLETELSQEQADEFLLKFKTPADLLNFSFRIPNTIHECVVKCSFSDISRQILNNTLPTATP